jgi:metal-responsive CopG/Arc/MetJ family transcriptional regulator/predicted RNase H-like HicB family nuclease
MAAYTAVITRCGDRFHAVLADFPALVADGATIEEARTRASRALEDHLATVGADTVPTRARPLDAVLAEVTGTAIVVELAVTSPKSPSIRINITIPENLLTAVDRAAEAHGMSRSRFLAKAVEAVVTGQRHQGIQIPLDDETLAAVDRAAEAHQMNRVPFLSALIKSTVTRTAHSS